MIQNESTIANQITTGAINYAPLTGPDADRFGGDGFTTVTSPIINFMLVFNERPGRPTADVEVRRAIAQAIDVAAFNDAAARGKGEPMTSIAPATAPCVSTDPALLVPADPQAAASVLSGMTLKLVGTNAVAGGAGNAYVQAALQQAGAQVELKNTDNATWASDVMGNQGDWDVTVFPHLNLTNTVTAAATLFAGPAAPNGRNVGGVENPEFAAAMATALATPDGPAKCDAWAQAQRALLERVDAVPLTSAVVTYVFDERATAASPGQFVDIATLAIPN
ncbi:ABC transporter substrate-binding protein [Pseudonocardia nigra]|uniref:ABC transporter substrate-binding protein n=1 Tax=Pseudonocardia nigra TaxID=1921578 RepID=UPI001C5DC5DB|nr:ABC transporter substrate-binding protein [Pseudonocardia nigra]